MAGGKLASYRLFAEEAANAIAKELGNDEPCRTHEEALPGGEATPDVQKLAAQFRWPLNAVGRLAYRHGARAPRVMDFADSRPGGGCVVCTCEPVTEGEIAYVVQNESVRRLADIRRRTRLAMGGCQGARCFPRAAAVLREVGNLTAQESIREWRDALTARWRGMKPVMEGPNMAVAELTQHVHFGVGALDDLWQGPSS